MEMGELSDLLAGAMRRVNTIRAPELRQRSLERRRAEKAGAPRGHVDSCEEYLSSCWAIEAEIDWHEEEMLLPGDRLLELAIRREWLPVHLQNHILNAGPGTKADPINQKQLHEKIIEHLRSGIDRDRAHYNP